MVSFILDKKIFFISIINLFIAYKLYFYLKWSEKEIITIPIVMKVENEFFYQSLVTITSLIENSSKETKYDIFILVPKRFLIPNRLKLLTLEVKYKNIKINLVESEEPFVKVKHFKSNYYKIFLAFLIPNYDKIIYLNYNTLVFEDLLPLFNIDLKDNYFMGFLNNDNSTYFHLNLKSEKNINTNVLLVNIKKLKENNLLQEFRKLYLKYIDNKLMNDQIMINILYKDNIGILPPKFGIPNFENGEIALEYNKKIPEKYRYEENDFISAYYEPKIMEFIYKPWELGNKCQRNEAWWFYAKKTDYYDEIQNNIEKINEIKE